VEPIRRSTLAEAREQRRVEAEARAAQGAVHGPALPPTPSAPGAASAAAPAAGGVGGGAGTSPSAAAAAAAAVAGTAPRTGYELERGEQSGLARARAASTLAG
jgi:hypothetical protein